VPQSPRALHLRSAPGMFFPIPEDDKICPPPGPGVDTRSLRAAPVSCRLFLPDGILSVAVAIFEALRISLPCSPSRGWARGTWARRCLSSLLREVSVICSLFGRHNRSSKEQLVKIRPAEKHSAVGFLSDGGIFAASRRAGPRSCEAEADLALHKGVACFRMSQGPSSRELVARTKKMGIRSLRCRCHQKLPSRICHRLSARPSTEDGDSTLRIEDLPRRRASS